MIAFHGLACLVKTKIICILGISILFLFLFHSIVIDFKAIDMLLSIVKSILLIFSILKVTIVFLTHTEKSLNGSLIFNPLIKCLLMQLLQNKI